VPAGTSRSTSRCYGIPAVTRVMAYVANAVTLWRCRQQCVLAALNLLRVHWRHQPWNGCIEYSVALTCDLIRKKYTLGDIPNKIRASVLEFCWIFFLIFGFKENILKYEWDLSQMQCFSNKCYVSLITTVKICLRRIVSFSHSSLVLYCIVSNSDNKLKWFECRTRT
jgi:hypothetical protein